MLGSLGRILTTMQLLPAHLLVSALLSSCARRRSHAAAGIERFCENEDVPSSPNTFLHGINTSGQQVLLLVSGTTRRLCSCSISASKPDLSASVGRRGRRNTMLLTYPPRQTCAR